MITRADTLDVIAVVVACHHRTAPRMDDRDALRATADIWADLFNMHNLTLPDLIAAVKKRATIHPDAPEPAEIIAFAREERRRRDAETGPTPEYEALCEDKAEDADELAANRRARAGAPKIERAEIKQLVASIASTKGVDHA